MGSSSATGIALAMGDTTMPNLIPFQFQAHAISVITHDDGEQWFIAKEVCELLGLANVSMAVSRLNPREKTDIILTDSANSNQSMLIISEPGLYGLESRRF
jgi:anti-repressor protein